MKQFLKSLFLPENKKARTNLMMAFAVGVLLLVMSKTFFTETPEETPPPKAAETKVPDQEAGTERSMEKRLAEILAQIEGAGMVEVMITLKASPETVLAQEEKTEHSTEQNSSGGVNEMQKREQTVVMTEDSNGNSAPVVLQERVAEIEGVVVVAQGGGDAVVQNALTQAAQALLNVPAHKVAILKMK